MFHREFPCDGGRRYARDHGSEDRHHGRGGGRGSWGRSGGGGRGGRVFDHGELRLVILALIAEKPSHGYELIKAIEERVAGAYSPSPGVVYPTLTLLEELGHVTVESGGDGKKLYAVTAEGKAFLAANETAIKAIFARMVEAGRLHGRSAAPEILRAMENLKVAVKLRVTRETLSREEIQAIAAAIDAAALAVERS